MAIAPRLIRSPATQQFLLGQSLSQQAANQAGQPVYATSQGLARIAQALGGALLQNRAQQKFKEEQAADAASLASMLGGAGFTPGEAALFASELPGARDAGAAAISARNARELAQLRADSQVTFRPLTEEELNQYSSSGYPEDLLKLARVGSDGSIKLPPQLKSAPNVKLLTFEKDGQRKTVTAGAKADISALIADGWVESRTPAVQVNTAPPGYEPDPDNPGSLRPIVGGPGDKFTAGEAKSASFANRMFAVIPDLEDPKLVDALLNPGEAFVANLPGGNFIASPEFQKANRAVTDFINAQLREESGAVIGPTEFANAYEQYIPKPGDKPEVIEAKAKARREAAENMAQAAGRKYERPTGFEVPEKVDF